MRSKLAIVLFLLLAAISQAAKKSSSSTTHVREYTRKDGTVVHAHERAKPGTSEKSEAVAPDRPSKRSPGNYCASCERDAKGREIRSAAAKREFQRSKPCPATGSSSGPCPGHVIDHVKPLACGGADAPSNMAWQTTAEAKAKDRVERKGCK